MASSSAFPAPTLHFKLVSAARRSNSNRSRPFTQNSKPRKLRSRNYPPQVPLPSAIEGAEATTFTRLPPKDDFFSSNLALQSLAEVVRLSDAARTITKPKKLGRNIGENDGIDLNTDSNSEDFQVSDEFEENDFDYGKFELYEVGTDDEVSDLDEEEDVIVSGSEGDEEDNEEEIKEKEKGVPAVMRCFDRAKIFVKAGDGGNGVMAFRREKFIPFGGPSGGDGGRGGNVYLEVDGAMNSLLPFRKSLHFRAGRGDHGQGQQKNGAKGKHVVIKVPPGTVVKESGGDVLLELLHPGQRALLLPGGRGGRGNASFKTNMNRVPRIAENGEEGSELWLDLEMKLVADVGIVGAPNAGKSTFLSVISAAQPTIANYPFTTLLPNLGVVSFDYNATMVVADLPGLLEGAHRGFGLGHEFLRHTERCTVLVHIVDGSSQQPEYEFDAIRLELEMFNPELSVKPFVVVYNKMDLPEASENWESFREELQARGVEPFCMSAVTTEGTQEVIRSAYELVQKYKADKKEEGIKGQENLNYVADIMKKQRASPINEFDITQDRSTNTWHVVGGGLLRFAQMTNWRYEDSEKRFQHVLEACGVNKSLIKLGVKEGDNVVVGEMELVWHDAAESSGPTRKGKGAYETQD